MARALKFTVVAINDLLDAFENLKGLRRSDPEDVLLRLGDFASEALRIINHTAVSCPITWEGAGEKSYKVFSDAPDTSKWSRSVNTGLFIDDVDLFQQEFHNFAARIIADRGRLRVTGLTVAEIDRPVYTTVMSFAVLVDLYNPSRGMGGTFFEMIVGPLISLLTDRTEMGDVRLPVPGSTDEIIKVDLTFHDPEGGRSLAVPTKISTRERISQAFVHARILETAQPGKYRNIICIVNESNAFFYKGLPKNTASSVFLRETLVARTIALYQRYVAKMDGMYYLDPPEAYLAGTTAGLPPVKHFGELALQDLASLLP